MEPPSKGHGFFFGGTIIIKSAVLSFVERLSSFRSLPCVTIGIVNVIVRSRALSFVEKSIIIFILCPYLGGSTIRGFNVLLYLVIN